jgi:hypothetical protein
VILSLTPFSRVNVCLPFVNKKLSPFDQILRKVVLENVKLGSNKFVQVFTDVVVAFKDTVYIFYYEIHLKYCQDTDVY